MIKYTASGRAASATTDEPLTTGSVGIPVEVELSSDFEGLACTMVCACGPRSADVALLGQDVTVPAQLLRHAGHWLRIGVWAAREDGTVVIPTVWADVGLVRRGAEPSGVDPTAPTPSWVAQVQQAAAEATAVAEAAARGDFDGADGANGADGFSPTATVTQTDAGATITITDMDGTTTADVANGAGAAENLTPFFSCPLESYSASDPYWRPTWGIQLIDFLGNGWAHVEQENSNSAEQPWTDSRFTPRAIAGLEPGAAYTLLVEVRNLEVGGTRGWAGIRVSGAANSQTQLYTPQSSGKGRSGVGETFDLAEDCVMRIPIYVQANPDASGRKELVEVGVTTAGQTSVSCDMRVSLYDGEYDGPWRPCLWWLETAIDKLRAANTEQAATIAILEERVAVLEGGS